MRIHSNKWLPNTCYTDVKPRNSSNFNGTEIRNTQYVETWGCHKIVSLEGISMPWILSKSWQPNSICLNYHWTKLDKISWNMKCTKNNVHWPNFLLFDVLYSTGRVLGKTQNCCNVCIDKSGSLTTRLDLAHFLITKTIPRIRSKYIWEVQRSMNGLNIS